MKLKELRKKNTKELNVKLIELLRNYFLLNIKKKCNQKKQYYFIKQTRLNIAQIKMLLTEKLNGENNNTIHE